MQVERKDEKLGKEHGSLRYFLGSLNSEYTKTAYRFYINKYLQITGYDDIEKFLEKSRNNPKDIEDQLIEFIISLKESGSKFSTIVNYVKPVVKFLKETDVLINYNKVNRFVPPYVRNRKTRGYSREEISSLLQVADERMRALILILSSAGLRINGLCGLTVGSLQEANDGKLYQITVYENEPEEYVTFCSSECKVWGIDAYLKMRERYGEVITNKSPLIREQFDRRDPWAAAHAKFVTASVLTKKLVAMAEAVGIRTKSQLAKGQKAASVLQAIPVCNGMRRFYSTTLVDSEVNTEKRWLLEGHMLKRNDPSYVHETKEKLLVEYLKGHDNLLISQEHKLRQRVEKLEVERSQLDRLALQLAALEKKIESK
jgi:site-specific recombinase XerD